MIGQKNIQATVKRLTEENLFPRFLILVGPKGSGRKLLATDVICKYLKATPVFVPATVEGVREVIGNASTFTANRCVYIVADADKMSPAAKNSLLKFTEEPPRNAYIVLTLTSIANTLATIQSRGYTMYMDPYTEDNIDEYYHNNYSSFTDERRIIDDVCSTPGDVDRLVEAGAVDMHEYVEKVIDNISLVTGANAFKIAKEIKFKEDGAGYPLDLFLYMFRSICRARMTDMQATAAEIEHYADGIRVATSTINDLSITGVNKSMLFDRFILEIRRWWIEWN